jgi:hypothetical protein
MQATVLRRVGTPPGSHRSVGIEMTRRLPAKGGEMIRVRKTDRKVTPALSVSKAN